MVRQDSVKSLRPFTTLRRLNQFLSEQRRSMNVSVSTPEGHELPEPWRITQELVDRIGSHGGEANSDADRDSDSRKLAKDLKVKKYRKSERYNKSISEELKRTREMVVRMGEARRAERQVVARSLDEIRTDLPGLTPYVRNK
ncbi:hypothetical protein CC1G_00578 [Coprinopsis cinerea okayama7|uniref:Uncharacterized protein n=1 Tax=Coprinopsis cinerea (strain Okayama-7 / 130 / ATCC MYA-4618 / FGSC 9003) TaxID=240176 RepID=A8N3W6_COPC7|nr:hypothetical protein CC1G_00578 [Coprinopsis cinerea okayama7\|eukprot:XP_001829399.2 hypothetical protein CC1G_00578 [Coprinopsis cinerea okayama7\